MTPEFCTQLIAAASASLDEWLATTDHLFDCIGYSEGQFCCLDRDHRQEKVLRLMVDVVVPMVRQPYVDALRALTDALDKGESAALADAYAEALNLVGGIGKTP